jgi:hypothetical protein
MAFSLQAIGLAIIVLVMWFIALLSAKHVRFQDILGTVTLAKYPLILAAIVSLAFGNQLAAFSDKLMSMTVSQMVNEITLSDSEPLLAFSMLLLPIIVLEIALLFNAFRVSTNLKGSKSAVLFIVIILISEIITNVLAFFFYR